MGKKPKYYAKCSPTRWTVYERRPFWWDKAVGVFIIDQLPMQTYERDVVPFIKIKN